MNPVNLVGLASGIVTFTVLVLAAGLCFRAHGRSPLGLNLVKAIGPLSVATAIWSLAVAAPASWRTAAPGVALFSGSLALFLWALVAHRRRWLTRVYCDDVPVHLVTTGPYRWVRHPCYSAYLLAYAGALVASRNLLVIPVLLVNGILYLHAGRVEERKFAGSPLAADYDTYRRRTGMLWPNPLKIFGPNR